MCTSSSAVHVEFASSYSTDSFLLVLQRFICVGRVQSPIKSDNGEQLVAASKQLQALNAKEIIERVRKKGIEWQLVPTGGQHFNDEQCE